MKNERYTAITLFGLEHVLEKELEALGASNVVIDSRTVHFQGTLPLLYKANLWLRSAIRIIKPLQQFEAKDIEQLYHNIYSFDWNTILQPDDTFAIQNNTYSEVFKNGNYAARKAKDAIVDKIRAHTGERPNVDVDYPDFLININIKDTYCIISLDSSGESLHKRGYRREKNVAPLTETLAAGLVLMTGWRGDKDFIDPMCGSGTIAIEAALIAKNIPPQRDRREFRFMKWSNYDPYLWQQIRKHATKMKKSSVPDIVASDISAHACSITQRNAGRAGILNDIHIIKSDFRRLSQKLPKRMQNNREGLLVMNPPYGERMKQQNITQLYKNIGDTLKQDFSGHEAWIFSANRNALKNIGLRTSEKHIIFNGPIETRLQKYELY